MPGYTFAPVFCARQSSNSEVHVDFCSSFRILSTIAQASFARGEREERNAWSEEYVIRGGEGGAGGAHQSVDSFLVR